MSKELKFSKEARDALVKGMNIVANAVVATLGPKGRNVVIDRGHETPLVTNDGVTIAKEIELEDKYENLGAQLIIEVASKTNDVAGDGTTTATCLAQAMITSGMKAVEKGANPVFLKEGIDIASKIVREKLMEKSRAITTNLEIENIATISSSDSEIGKIIAQAIARIGRDGVITVDEANLFETSLEVVDGLRFDRGYVSPHMVTNRDKMEAVLENALILVTDYKINTVQEILPILEGIVKYNKPLLMIAEDYDNEVVSTIIVNKLRGTVNCVAVKAPGFGTHQTDLLEDIAILTNTKFCSKQLGMFLEDLRMEDLGIVQKTVINKDSTTLIASKQDHDALKQRIEEIKSLLTRATSDYQKERCQERIGKLSNGVAIIKAGAATEAEMKHKKMKIEDAVNATKAAVEEGIVIGGGAALVEIYKELKPILKNEIVDIQRGMNIVLEALLSPIYWIAENAGYDGDKIVNMQLESKLNIGFNAKEGTWVNMLETGIIDPTKVTKTGIINAASIASLFITTEAVITNLNKEKHQIGELI